MSPSQPLSQQEYENLKNSLPPLNFPLPDQLNQNQFYGSSIPRTIDVDPQPEYKVPARPSKPPSTRPPGKANPPAEVPTSTPSPSTAPAIPNPGSRARRRRFKLPQLTGLISLFKSAGGGEKEKDFEQSEDRQSRRSRKSNSNSNSNSSRHIPSIKEFWESFTKQVPLYFLLLEVFSSLIKPLSAAGFVPLAQALSSVLTPGGFLFPFLVASVILARFQKWKQVEFTVACLCSYLIKFLLVLIQG